MGGLRIPDGEYPTYSGSIEIPPHPDDIYRPGGTLPDGTPYPGILVPAAGLPLPEDYYEQVPPAARNLTPREALVGVGGVGLAALVLTAGLAMGGTPSSVATGIQPPTPTPGIGTTAPSSAVAGVNAGDTGMAAPADDPGSWSLVDNNPSLRYTAGFTPAGTLQVELCDISGGQTATPKTVVARQVDRPQDAQPVDMGWQSFDKQRQVLDKNGQPFALASCTQAFWTQSALGEMPKDAVGVTVGDGPTVMVNTQTGKTTTFTMTPAQAEHANYPNKSAMVATPTKPKPQQQKAKDKNAHARSVHHHTGKRR